MRSRWVVLVGIVPLVCALVSPVGAAAGTPPTIPPPSGARYTMGPDFTMSGAPGPITTPAETARSPFVALPPTPVPDPTLPASPNPDAGLVLTPMTPSLAPLPTPPPPNTPQNYHFSGLTQVGSTVPSDSSAAGGPSNVVEEVNQQIAIYNRSGSQTLAGPQTLQQWYGKLSDKIFDTHVLFEPQHKHFFTIAEDGTTNHWLMKVSLTSDATAGWCSYDLPALNSGSTSVDFPLIGASTNDIILTIVEKPDNGNRLVEIPKSQLESCQSYNGWVWTNILDPGVGTAAHPIVPALNYNAGDTNTYLIDSYANGGAHVSLYTIDSSNHLQAEQVSTPAYGQAARAAQPNSSVVVMVGNTSITQAVNYDYGMDVALTTYHGATGSDILWMRFDPTAQTLLRTKLISLGSSIWMFYPSTSQTYTGTTLITYSLSSASIYPSLAVMGLDANQNYTKSVYLVIGDHSTPQSQTCSGVPCSRWGDFTSTYTDPVVVSSFWSAGQVMHSSSVWGTVMGMQSPS